MFGTKKPAVTISGSAAPRGPVGTVPVPTAIPRSPVFNASGHAGPRRILVILGGMAGVVAFVVIVTHLGQQAPVLSRDAPMHKVDPLPGGLHSNTEQDALAAVSNNARAAAAARTGASFTPPMAASVPVRTATQEAPLLAPSLPRPTAFIRPRPKPVQLTQVSFPEPVGEPGDAPAAPVQAPVQGAPVQVAEVQNAAATVDAQAEQQDLHQIGDIFSRWGGQVPRTVVLLPPATDADANADADAVAGAPRTHDPAQAIPAAADRAAIGRVLIPAGRGIYAHPILALNSDATSPVVLQADSGPIAGDRMIGTFSRENDRLIIRVNRIIHGGRSLGAEGVVIAPDTMEAAVASGVDEHYMTRFVLPAAAAFVRGLGEAIATTSNTATVLSPFGGASALTQLNLHQQLGVAAGAAANNIGNALSQAAPKGPTVMLDANVSVGVIFLSNVIEQRA